MTQPTPQTYDADYFRNQIASEKERLASAGTRNEYFKLSGGQSDFRILPSQPLFVVMKKHGYTNSEGRFTSALDYGFILGDPELQEAAIAKGAITGEDLAAAGEFGDPFSVVARTAQQFGVDKDQLRGLWPRTRYLWNVIDRQADEPKVVLFESSKTFFDEITDVFEQAPDLFDPESGRDIGVKGNGRDGIQRRYKSPKAALQTSPIGVDGWEENLIDLEGVVLRAVRPWAEKARAMFAKHGDLAAQVGITPDAWGI